MSKIIFELTDYKESPNSPSKLNIEIRYEPLKQNGRANELAEFILDAIDDFNTKHGGNPNIKDVKKY